MPKEDILIRLVISTPVGALGLHFVNEELIKVELHATQKNRQTSWPDAIQKKINLIHAFFRQPCNLSALEKGLRGTAFQRKVWHALSLIPIGQTQTYGEIAKKLKTSARAIGMACRTNPLPVVIPCHRVVSKVDLGGYCGKRSGQLFKIKKWLLEHEQRYTASNF